MRCGSQSNSTENQLVSTCRLLFSNNNNNNKMKLQIMILAVALVTIIGPAASTVYSPCQLATVLPQCGLNYNVNDWVCLVMSESSGNTRATDPPNSDGSIDYGLFQINNRYWCGQNGPGGECNIACSDLLNDDISDDCACANLIHSIQGFPAWNGWKAKCQPAPAVSPC